MQEYRKIIVFTVLLILSLLNIYIMNETEPIRFVSFLKCFVAGFLASRLVFLLIDKFNKNQIK